MEVETIRTLAAWLEHEDHGVNALLPDMPRWAGDDAPPQVGTVLNHMDDTDLALWLGVASGKAWPLLTVTLPQSSELTGDRPVIDQDGEITVAIRYATRDRKHGARHAAYTLRAVRRALNDLFLNDHGLARLANGVELVAIKSVRPYHPHQPREDGPYTYANLVTIEVRDFAALPA